MTLTLKYSYLGREFIITNHTLEDGRVQYRATLNNLLYLPGDTVEDAKVKAQNYIDRVESRLKALQLSKSSPPAAI